MNLFFTEPCGSREKRRNRLSRNPAFMLMVRVSFCYAVLALLSIRLLFAGPAKGQNLEELRLTLELKNEQLKTVFEELERLTVLQFAYNPKEIGNYRVTLPKRVYTVKEILEQSLRHTSLNYRQLRRSIIIYPAREPQKSPEPLPVPDPAAVVPKSVSGTVKSEKGEGLPGVSILVKGTQLGTVTNAEGGFILELPKDDAVLVFSFVGYLPQEVPVNGQATLEVQMVVDTKALEEVVVVGYGTQKKVNLTGAVDVVSGEQLTNRPAANVGSLLQGVSPNLNITTSSAGGEPGAAPVWNIRGIGSLSGGGPLILVDGIEMNINNLDPESIESVSVLKDAAASAIYGSRAPFGVVLITTKKGTNKKGVSITYTNNIAFASPMNLPRMQNSLAYVTAQNQMYTNAGLAPKYTEEQIDRIKRYMAGTYLPEYDTLVPPNSLWRGRHEGNANYEWVDMAYKDYAVNQKHALSLSGGDEKTRFYVSAGYFNQGTAYNWVDEYYRRYNILSNLSTSPTSWLKFNLNTKFANSGSRHPNGSSGLDKMQMMLGIMTFPPITPMYNWNGSVSHPHIKQMMEGGRETNFSNDLWTTISTEAEPVKGWKTNLMYSYNYMTSKYTKLDKQVFVEVPNGTFGNIGAPQSGYTQSWDADTYSSLSLTSTYQKDVARHHFQLMGGYEQEVKKYSNLFGNRRELITDAVPSISTATGTYQLDDNMSHWATQAVFGRFNYNFDEKYLLEVNARYNGSSRFARASRWALFPSFSAGYNLSREAFWAPLEKVVNNLKIRGSYGTLGNQNVPNYLYLANIPISNNLEWVLNNIRPNYARLPNIISSNLTWEEITTANIGLDAEFLRNRLGLVFDWYRRDTKNMFGPAMVLPAVLGTSAPRENNASMTTRGWELTVSWRDQLQNGLNYDLKLALADNKSVVTQYLNERGVIDSYYPGKRIGEIWGYETDGFIRTEGESIPDQSRFFNKWGPGDIRYKDRDGNNVINDGQRTLQDHGDLKVIGNNQPRYTFGFTAAAGWKGIDFSMFWQGVAKRDLWPSARHFWGLLSRDMLFYDGHEDYWRPADETNMFGPNTDAYYPKPYYSAEADKNMQPQTKYLQSGAYLRLKNLQIGYTIPAKLSRRVALSKIRVYFSGENLVTFTGLTPLLDPETAFVPNDFGMGMTYPLFKSYSCGINLSF